MKNLVRTMLFFCVAFVFASQTPPQGKHNVKPLKINTSHSDYAVTFLPNDKVVFVSPANDSPYSPIDFFIGDVNEEGEIISKKPLKGVAQNNKISKTGITYSQDYKKVFFSAREFKKKSKRKFNDRIFVADVDAKGNWKNIKKPSFNNDKYISKNPVLSNDGKKLYFVSNRKSTFGGLDIFVVDVNTDGTFGQPKNLGETINTKGDEITPFISNDNILYFSSNGRDDSFGNFDVYASQILENSVATPMHLDASINGTSDDIAYLIKNDKGYFSSNRSENKNINIYAFSIDRDKKEDLIVTNNEPSKDQISMTRKEDQPLTSVITNHTKEKEAMIEVKQKKAETIKEEVKVRKAAEEKAALALKEKQQLENKEKIVALEAKKKAAIEAKEKEALVLQKKLQKQKEAKENAAIASKKMQQKKRQEEIVVKEAKKQAEIQRKREQAIAEKQRIKEEKAAKKAAIIANKKVIATKKNLEVKQAKENQTLVTETTQKATNNVNLNQTEKSVSTSLITSDNSNLSTIKEPLKTQVSKYHIKYMETNTVKSDYAVAYYNNNVVFVTPLDAESKRDRSDLFIGGIDEGHEIINKKGLKGIAPNKKISKTGVTFSKDLKTVYFSAKKNSRKAKDQLFSAAIDANGNWINVKKLPFNSKKYTSGQPTLSADGKKLYFISDRPGSYGDGTDIFVVNVNDDGTYGEPINLGEKINTRGNEVTPFITDDNVLYFSSTGHVDNQGGLDVYSSQIINNSASKVKHLDAPINGINNDFAFIKNNDRGYFSSNRLQGQDNNDIYSFILIEEKPKKCIQEIAGIVKDRETLEILNDAALTLFDEEGNQLKQVLTDSKGKYALTLDCNKTYTLIASSLHYVKEEHIVNTANYMDAPALEANKLLVKKQAGEPEDIIAVTKTIKDNVEDGITDTETNENKTELTTNTETTKEVLNLSTVSVYYDFDSYEIRYDATDELDRVVAMMKENTMVKVQVNAYTDSRGSSTYNLGLSKRRANAAINYMVSKGISRTRLRAKGFGESQMVNHCVNGVECSEAAHQMNRRTEFVILN